MDRVNHPGGAEGMKTKKPRWSAKKKAEAVLRLLRGEGLEELSRELRVPSRRSRPELSRWREEFIEAGTEGLRLARRANLGSR
jgi:transposase-like protein